VAAAAQPKNAGDGWLTDGTNVVSTVPNTHYVTGLFKYTPIVDAGSFTGTLPGGFIQMQSGITGNEQTFLGDLDNDGKLDLLWVYDAGANSSESGTAVWKGNGDGTFSHTPVVDKGAFLGGAMPTGGSNYIQAGVTGNESTFLVDTNSDGKLDLLWNFDGGGAAVNSGTWVWLGNGNGTFQHTPVIDRGAFLGGAIPGGTNIIQAGYTGNESTHVADVNDDGKVDIIWIYDGGCVVANSGTWVWLGNGDGTFQHTPIQDKGSFGASTICSGNQNLIQGGVTANEQTYMADFNNDGKIDILWTYDAGAASASSGTWVWLGNGNGTFQHTPIADQGTFLGPGPTGGKNYIQGGLTANEDARVADVNGDGNMDIVFRYDAGGNKYFTAVQVWLGNGNGTFQHTPVTQQGGFTGTIPGCTDCLQAGYTGNEISFIGDVNNDGRIDLISTFDQGWGAAASGTYVWLADDSVTPTITTAPGGVDTDLMLWLKSDLGAGSSDGQAVSNWLDQSGYNYNLNQPNATFQPKYYSTTVGKLVNFNPSVEFDGIDDFVRNTNRLMLGTNAYTMLAVSIDEDTGAGSFRKVFGLEPWDWFGLYKQGGAPGNNGWVPYGIAGVPDYGKMGKGTKYSIAGGANGYWNGTNFSSDSRTQNSQPQISGFMSENELTTDPMHSWVDGYKENPGWSFIDELGQQPGYFFFRTALGADFDGISGVEVWKGKINEFLVYSRVLTDAEMAAVNTYLAIKWGITLGQGDGRVGNNLAYDYVASDGTVIWNAAAYATYGHNIAGIGRDDTSALNQKQSKSVNKNGLVTMGLGTIATTNAANANSFTADKNFMLWGDNNAVATLTSNYNGGTNNRITRVWRTTETGTVGSVLVRIPTSVATGLQSIIVHATDPNFGTVDRAFALTINGSNYEATVNFNNGDYFTFSTNPPSGPGTLTKAFSPASVTAGQPSVLTFTITNSSGNPTQSGIVFTDTLPAGLIVATPPGVSNTCGGTVTATAGSGSISLSGGAMSSGTPSCTLSVNVTSNTASNYTNGAANVSGTTNLTNGVTNQTLTVVTPATLTLTKAFTASTVSTIQTVAAIFVLTNSSGNPAQSGLDFTDTLPAGLVVATPPNVSNTCNGTVTATAGSGSISLSGGSMSNGTASCTISVDVTPSGLGTYTNDSSNISGTNNMTNGVTSQTTTIVNPPTLTKAFSPTTISVGQPSTLTFTVTNSSSDGNPVQNGIDFTDTLPAGLIVATPPSVSNTCGGTVTATAGSGSISLSGGSMSNGTATCTLAVHVTSNTASNYTNGAGDISGTANLINSVTNQTLTVTVNSDLSVAKVAQGTFTAGGNGQYKITVSNAGPSDSAGTTTVNETLPAGVTAYTVNAGSTPGWSCTGSVPNVTCTNSNAILSSGSSILLLDVTLGANAPNPLGANTVSVSNPNDQNSGNDGPASSGTTPVTNNFDLSIAKVAQGTFTAGGNGQYKITVSNAGPSDSSGTTTVNETLPAGVTGYSVNAGSTPGWSCTGSVPNVTCTNLNPIAAAGDSILLLDVTLSAGVSNPLGANMASVSNSGDSTPGNDGPASSGTTPVGNVTDTDGDGVADSADADDDGDGIPDTVEGNGTIDTDGDGIPNSLDLDSDNDGINDVREAGGLTDANGDGRADGSDGNGDGMVDSAQNNPIDTDGDGQEDYIDLDSDNDSVSDLVEGGSGATDANNDGVADGPDADSDGIVDSADGDDGNAGDSGDTAPTNTDGDGLPNYIDPDSDGDGLPDIDEAGNGALDADNDGDIDNAADADHDGVPNNIDTNDAQFGGIGAPDFDGDGTPDNLDTDDDNDGIPDANEGNGSVDTDGDGLADSMDADSDGDGIPDSVESNVDTDGDGVPNFRDLDSDNDGINDVREAGGLADADGDGKADGTDGNGDGAIDTAQTNPIDTDGDGQDDYVDIDSDNDSISDLVEGGSGAADANNDGIADGPDADGDGIVDSADGNDANFGDSGDAPPTNTDGTDQPDYLDSDSNNDGTLDIDDAGNGNLDADDDGDIDDATDADHDGAPDNVDNNDGQFGGLPNAFGDQDGDGISDNIEDSVDTDGDGLIDKLDADSDGDGIPDSVEGNVDTDGDGVPNFRDLDSDNDGINDVREAGGLTDANGDGKADGTDGNGDGAIDTAQTNPVDTDGDGADDYVDLDSDNDSISDLEEGGSGATDTNNDGIADGPDGDGDGIVDSADGNDAVFGDSGDTAPTNTDGDGLPDYIDPDSDGDGTLDIDEQGNGGLDADNDGDIDDATDADHDGVPDNIDSFDGRFGGLGALPFITVTKDAVNAKTGSATDFKEGDIIKYTIVISNTGTADMPNNPGAEMIDQIGAGVKPRSRGDTASSGTLTYTAASRTYTWNGSIPAGGSVTITFEVTIQKGAGSDTFIPLVCNQAAVSIDADLNGSNETTILTTDPTPIAGAPGAQTCIALPAKGRRCNIILYPKCDQFGALQLDALRVSYRRNMMQFQAQGQSIKEIEVRIFGLSGSAIYLSGWVENGHLWRLNSTNGKKIANGVYLYVVTVKGFDGKILRTHIKKLVINR
jgi:uncharacterized repeat protein (TIGR01451 family)